MSQNPLVVPDGTGAQVRANLNLALDTINTLNSGPAAPSNPEAYMLWADTGTGYLKQRNSANNAWVALRPLDPSVPLATNSGNAYSISLNPAITAYVGGVVYKFIPNVNSTGAATLNINGLGAISIVGATLTANQPALVVYDATDGVLVMMGGAGGTPVGALMPYGGAAAPTGWLLCQGQAVSRTTYASLFSILGTAYGAGDGSITFNLPNLKQRFPLGKADSGTGSTLGGSGGAIDFSVPALALASASINALVDENNMSIGTYQLASGLAAQTVAGPGPYNPSFQVFNFIIKY
jgi:microcystin-dependent protein